MEPTRPHEHSLIDPDKVNHNYVQFSNCSLLQSPTQAPRWHKVYWSRYLGTFPQEYWSPWSYPGSDQHQPWPFTCCDSCGSLGHLVCSVRALYYFVRCDGNSSVYEQGQI